MRINAWNEKYCVVGGIGVNSPGADVFLFSHLFMLALLMLLLFWLAPLLRGPQ